MTSIFISYRRSDSTDVVGRIYDQLSKHFGKDAVFKDVDSIPAAADVPQEIDDQIKVSKVVLAVIGANWLKVLNERLTDPHDWVRIELETALLYKVPILPVLINGAKMPEATELPIELRVLTKKNARWVRQDPDFHPDMQRLINGLEKQFNLVGFSKGEEQSKIAQPRIPQVWLHGWSTYQPSVEDEPADFQLPWSDYYQKPSTFPSLEEWKESLEPELRKLKQKIADSFPSQLVEFRSTLPLAPMVAVGHLFSKAGHYKLKIKQGEEIWKSEGVAPSSKSFEAKTIQDRAGSDLLIGFSVTGDAWPAMEKLLETSSIAFDSVVHARLSKLGSTAINNSDAVALATQAKDLIRDYKQRYSAICIHLVVFCPVAYALFLGQFLNGLGDIVVYEYKDGSYQAAVKLLT